MVYLANMANMANTRRSLNKNSNDMAKPFENGDFDENGEFGENVEYSESSSTPPLEKWQFWRIWLKWRIWCWKGSFDCGYFDKNGESGENFAIGLANIQIGLLKGSLGLSILSKMANPVKIPKMRKLARGHLQNINVTRLALHNPWGNIYQIQLNQIHQKTPRKQQINGSGVNYVLAPCTSQVK